MDKCTMQSDDLFIRKFRRQSPRPNLAAVSFDPKRENGDPFLLLGLQETPPEPDGFFRALSAPAGDTPKPAKPPKPESLGKKAKPTSPQILPEQPVGGGWVRNFAHYDVQSILFDLTEAATNRDSVGGSNVEEPEQALPNDAVSVLEEPRESHIQQQGKSNYFIEHADLGARYYHKYFYMKDHQNFFGMDERLGPVAISFRREEKEASSGAQYNYRIIFRTTELKTLRGSILEESVPSAARHTTPRGISPKRLLEFILPDLNLHCLRLASTSPKVRDTLLKLDEQGLNFQRKVGVMYCRAGQSTEEDMYNNESAGPAFDEFLDLLGERVRLKGWEKYRAQLDTKTDSTGTHSLYTRYQDYEIMFHVSTMLPYTANNRQQLLRKRHIGNDIVTIVFQEPGALPFTPKAIRSHFQHVFIIVQVHEPCTENTYYRVAVTRSKDIPLFGPLFPKGARFPRSLAFRDFLLAKAINAENAAEKSEKFRSMATRTRQEYLKDLAENYRGEAVSITVPESQAEDIKEVVQRLELVTRGCEAREVTPLRDSVGQPGFLMSEEGFVTDLQRFCYAESDGLQKGARVVRLCGQPLVHLSQEERSRLLRTAPKIHITFVILSIVYLYVILTDRYFFNLSVLSETADSSEEEWQSISDLATACRSILEALSREVVLCVPLLRQEKEDKAVLQAEVQSLRQNNQRLQEESQTTVARMTQMLASPANKASHLKWICP
uniref:Rap-GAP domain-containing protein n=1 Tax=Pygocentrus nattereri TaxID=42514 RepID=A0AAR2KXP0_PYGNA